MTSLADADINGRVLMRRFLAGLVLTLLAAAPVFTKDQTKARPPLPAPEPVTIVLGNVMLHLGMGEADLLQRLRASYDVTPATGAPGSFLIRPTGQPGEVLGSVTFSDGRLAAASRQWTTAKTITANDYATSLIDVLRSMSGASPCSIAEVNRPAVDSGSAAVTTSIVCGQRTIEIRRAASGTSGAAVSEIIRSR